MHWITQVLETIKTATGYEPHLMGGNVHSPVEYSLFKITYNKYRLSVKTNFKSISDAMGVSDTISNAIADFYDYPKFDNMSIVVSGGGSTHVDALEQNTVIYDIILYDIEGDLPPFPPSGDISITENGEYDVSSYASATVNVPTGGVDVSDTTLVAAKAPRHTQFHTADGTLVEGTLKNCSVDGPIIQNGYPVIDGDNFKWVINEFYGGYVAVNGDSIISERSMYGDATPDKVVKDTVFTSSTGFNQVGTLTLPTGTKTITENGEYDIYDYEDVVVEVPLPSGSITLTTNGSHDVNDYSTAIVAVPEPTGTLSVDANGTYDCTDYASVEVDVPTPSGPTLSKENLLKTASVYSNLYTDKTVLEIESMLSVNEPTLSFSLTEQNWGGICISVDVSALHGHTIEFGLFSMNGVPQTAEYVLFGRGYSFANWLHAFSLENSGSGIYETQCCSEQPLYCFRATIPDDVDSFQLTFAWGFWNSPAASYKYTLPYMCDLGVLLGSSYPL